MANRDTNKIKKLIYDTLSADTTLINLLGGTNKIRYSNPTRSTEYPCVTHQIIAEEAEPYNEDQSSNICRSEIEIGVFSKGKESENLDDIEDRIYFLLHQKSIGNSEVKISNVQRVLKTPLYEPDVDVFRYVTRYTMVTILL